MDEEGWRTVRTLCHLERHILRGVHPDRDSCMRGLFRPVWSHRPARSDHYPDGTAAGLFFPLAVCVTLSASPVAGDSSTACWPGPGDYRITPPSVSVR